MNNPLQIAPGTIFISGAIRHTNGLPNDDFEKIEKALTEQGHKVFNPCKNVDCLDFKKRIAFMTMCAHVVTVNGWHDNEESCKEVSVARTLGMPVRFADAYIQANKELSEAFKDRHHAAR